MDLDHLSIIDLELSEKLAGNKKGLAQELMGLLIDTLPDDVTTIKQLYQSQNYIELLQQVHKLHGAVCYCGVPRLKKIIAHLEMNLKSNIISSLPSLLDRLDTEVNLLLKHYSSHPA